MAQRVSPPSFEELLLQIRELPEGVTGEILEPGRLRTMSRPGGAHRFVHRRVLSSLRAWDVAEGGSGWWVEVEAEIAFPGPRLAVPDVAAWRIEEPLPPSFVDDNPITVTPDLCVEILSPTTGREDRRLKLPLYASSGVTHTWLVDPEARLVEVFGCTDGKPVLLATAVDADVRSLPPFDAPLDVASWWKPGA